MTPMDRCDHNLLDAARHAKIRQPAPPFKVSLPALPKMTNIPSVSALPEKTSTSLAPSSEPSSVSVWPAATVALFVVRL